VFAVPIGTFPKLALVGVALSVPVAAACLGVTAIIKALMATAQQTASRRKAVRG